MNTRRFFIRRMVNDFSLIAVAAAVLAIVMACAMGPSGPDTAFADQDQSTPATGRTEVRSASHTKELAASDRFVFTSMGTSIEGQAVLLAIDDHLLPLKQT
ncbi:hypothetical protein OAS39_07640 [Pirellulales bacterium]|nr:hypothetical protein [Pirellulales bacterium]